MISLIMFIVIGLVAGWAAGNILKGGGFGLFGNLVIGCIGAIIGGFVFMLLGLTAHNIIGQLVTAIVGAVVFLFVLGWIRSRRT